jgi:nitroreductase
MTATVSQWIDRRYGMAVGLGADVAPAEGLVRMLSRRTHRKFTGAPVPEPLMQALFACMQSSASKSDLQQYSVIRVRDRALRGKIAALVAGLCVGYPSEAGEVTPHLPQAVVVHTDAYDDRELETRVARYDGVRPIPQAKQKNVDPYGVSAACAWSENVARQLSLPERAAFREFLQRHGFALR